MRTLDNEYVNGIYLLFSTKRIMCTQQLLLLWNLSNAFHKTL